MSLDIGAGERCFIDANIILYQLTNLPPFTSIVGPFLRRITAGKIKGFISSIVLSEVLHKLMLSEARALFPQAGRILPYLQKYPQAMGQLLVFPQATAKLAKIGMELLPVDLSVWGLDAKLAVQNSLFTNDACVLALMQMHGITHLATNDADFDGIPQIVVHKPT